MMAHVARPAPRNSSWRLLLSTVTLGLQRVHQAWGLLLMIGAGMLAAVMLVCAVPLDSDVAMTAVVPGTLNTYSQNEEIDVRSLPRLGSSSVTRKTTKKLHHEVQSHREPKLSNTQ